MGVASVGGGLTVHWGAEHKTADGKLIVRMASMQPPAWPGCNCVGKYLWWIFKYWLLMYYHEWRVQYAERKRHEPIPERYRTGEPSPKTIWQLFKEAMLLRIRMWLC